MYACSSNYYFRYYLWQQTSIYWSRFYIYATILCSCINNCNMCRWCHGITISII